MYLQCNKCQKEIEADWIICPTCGNPLDGNSEVAIVESAIKAWRKETKAKYVPSPSEETLYSMFQEGNGYIYTLRDEDCEICDFGAMAVIVAIKGSTVPVSICANCGHVQKLGAKEAHDRGLTFTQMNKEQKETKP
ncbi:MAG: hypothetical protein JRN21_09480 [Nitrososphaerota archaeon]|nr:hypothetical protein [Nitrososphaerota archaeon]